MTFAPQRDFLYQVSRGLVPGHKIVPFVLRKRGLGATLEDIGNIVGSIQFPSVAAPVSLVSTSALDNGVTPNTGARTLLVEGLDANYDEVSEIINLNGLTAVLTATSFLRVHKMTVLAAGSLLANQGSITAIVGGATQCIISVTSAGSSGGDNVSYQANYTVPRGKTAQILKAFVSTGKNMSGHIGLWVRPQAIGLFQEGFQTDAYQLFAFADFASQVTFPAKTDLIVRGFNTAAGTIDLFAYYSLLVIDDGA